MTPQLAQQISRQTSRGGFYPTHSLLILSPNSVLCKVRSNFLPPAATCLIIAGPAGSVRLGRVGAGIQTSHIHRRHLGKLTLVYLLAS